MNEYKLTSAAVYGTMPSNTPIAPTTLATYKTATILSYVQWVVIQVSLHCHKFNVISQTFI